MKVVRAAGAGSYPSEEAAESLEAARLRLQTICHSKSIHSLPISTLEKIELTKDVRFGDEIVQLPAEWFPAGSSQRPSLRNWRWQAMATFQNPVGSPIYNAARSSVMRALCALWITPRYSGKGHGTKLPKPSTYIARAKVLIFFTRQVLEMHDCKVVAGNLFLNLEDRQYYKAIAAASKAHPAEIPLVIRALDELRTRGFIADWLPPSKERQSLAAPRKKPKPDLERDRRGDENPISAPLTSSKWQPLPDAFITETGWRALWVIENIGPNLISCVRTLKGEGLLQSASMERNGESYRGFVRRRTGTVGKFQGSMQKTVAPFELAFDTQDIPDVLTAAVKRPAKKYYGIGSLITLLQGCHLFVVFLALGARWSEVASITRVSLQVTEDESEGISRVCGRTYKLVDNLGGVARDWPLPKVAVTAIRQQIELANVLTPGEDYLWLCKREDWGQLHTPNFLLDRLSSVVGTKDLLAGEGLHSHRFRKTVARLAALALVGAPKLLMDLFGHQSIEQTLRYILSDPGIAAEIEDVAKGMVIMLAKDAIRSADGNGGAAAKSLRNFLQDRTAVNGPTVFGSDTLEEVAEILTANGRAVMLVRPGILCTKQPGQAGPCTRSVGHPDPSRCSVDCGHRLELAAARQDAERAVVDCITFLRNPETQDNDLMAAFWKSQIKAQIKRFSDLRVRFADYPEVRSLIEEMAVA